MRLLGVGGLALGTTVSLTMNFFVLLYLLRRKIGPMGLSKMTGSLGKAAGASAVMGVAVWLVDRGLSGVVSETTGGFAVRVAAGLVAGLAVYVLAATLLRSSELAEARDMLRAVLKRS
jgi:putative peptidoglycan lipid II flippase